MPKTVDQHTHLELIQDAMAADYETDCNISEQEHISVERETSIELDESGAYCSAIRPNLKPNEEDSTRKPMQC